MEYEGVGIDVDFLHQYASLLAKEIQAAEASVFKQAGLSFNLASPKQLGEVLFDHMKLDPSAKKQKPVNTLPEKISCLSCVKNIRL